MARLAQRGLGGLEGQAFGRRAAAHARLHDDAAHAAQRHQRDHHQQDQADHQRDATLAAAIDMDGSEFHDCRLRKFTVKATLRTSRWPAPLVETP